MSDLRLSNVLAERLREEGHYVALAAAITAANANGGDGGERRGDVIDRRKLKKIVEGDSSLVLSLHELHCLDRYLEPLGHGLAYTSIFQRPNVLESLAEARHPVTFLLGSRPSEGYHLHLSHWDVQALAEIQRGVNKFGRDVRFDIRDVLLHSEVPDAQRSVRKGDWVKLLGDDGPSLVCLGSGRSNLAAEAILCRMCNVPTFDETDAAKRRLPFHFVWPAGRDHVFPSAFHRSPENLHGSRDGALALDKGASGLATATRIYEDRIASTHSGLCYGVCAVQRRRGGQIWAVFAGVSGPATYAAAQLSSRLAFNLHAVATGEVSPVLWAVVEAAVRRDSRRRAGTFLVVTDQKTVSGPLEWNPAA